MIGDLSLYYSLPNSQSFLESCLLIMLRLWAVNDDIFADANIRGKEMRMILFNMLPEILYKCPHCNRGIVFLRQKNIKGSLCMFIIQFIVIETCM